jgi:HSP20 family protein
MTKFFTKIQNNPTEPEEDFYVENNSESDVLENQPSLLPQEDFEDGLLDKENAEGQLSIDVFQTKDSLIIKSTIAGVSQNDIDIAIENDMITIRGMRKMEETVKEDDYFYQECYWGNFSRSIVLPMEIKPDEADATLKNGVLTITLPKSKKIKSVAVKVKSE